MDSFKTKSVRKEDVKKDWILVDADSQIVGRLASKIAVILRGKHKPSYTPHIECGDHVVVINADKLFVAIACQLCIGIVIPYK